jgi:hypothetical protein
MPTFNFNKRDGEQPPPVPPGSYEVAIKSSELKFRELTGDKYLLLGVDILSGPYQGHRLWESLTMQGKGTYYGKRDLAKILAIFGLKKSAKQKNCMTGR